MARHKVLTGIGAFIVLCLFATAVAPHSPGKATPTASPIVTSSPPPATAAASHPATSSALPAAPKKPAFPPETLAAFRTFAQTGDASQVTEISSSSQGLPSCPQPNLYVTVSPALTPREVEADLSAFFAQNGLLGNQCGAFVFAYKSEADYQANQNAGYTVGRVALDTNGGTTQENLEVDAGDSLSGPPQATFNFGF